ncbi:MAG: adenylate/guanylate cyclase domain-containing protein [Methylococcales bacterium]
MKWFKRFFELSSFKGSLIISIITLSFVIIFRGGGFFQALELWAYDRSVSANAQAGKPDPRIVLIGVTEDDFKSWGWPLGDWQLTRLLHQLMKHQPKAIGLDLLRAFPIPRDFRQTNTKDYQTLNNFLVEHTEIIAAEEYDGLGPPQSLVDSDQVGIIDFVRDDDGVVRRGFVYLLRPDGKRHYSLAAKLASIYLGFELPKGKPSGPTIQMGRSLLSRITSNDGGYVNADDGGFQVLLDFGRSHKSFTVFSMDKALALSISSSVLRNKIVIIGITAESEKDFAVTPLISSNGGKPRVDGIKMHAYLTSQFLNLAEGQAEQYQTLSESLEWLWIGTGSLIGAITAYAFRSLMALAGILVIEAVVVGSALWWGSLNGWWLPVVPVVFALALSLVLVTAYLSGQDWRQKNQIRNLFSRYVPRKIVKVLWSERNSLLEGVRPHPRNLTATILFSDIKGFTSLSENLEPNRLLEWLGEYMAAMVQNVSDYDGYVDKIIGDGVMCVFGAPLARTHTEEIRQDGQHAVNCALAMKKSLEVLNHRWELADLPLANIRIGIMTGPIVVGALGNAEHSEYTVLGDVVNTAACLESYAKKEPLYETTPCRIFIGETTYKLLGNAYDLAYVDNVHLGGKDSPVKVYRLDGFK